MRTQTTCHNPCCLSPSSLNHSLRRAYARAALHNMSFIPGYAAYDRLLSPFHGNSGESYSGPTAPIDYWFPTTENSMHYIVPGLFTQAQNASSDAISMLDRVHSIKTKSTMRAFESCIY